MTDTRDEVERLGTIRMLIESGTVPTNGEGRFLLARIATLEAERDALTARLPSPAAVRAARTKAAEVIEEHWTRACYERAQAEIYGLSLDEPSRCTACARVLRDLARTYLGTHDEGGDVDATTLAMIALDVDGLATLGELEEMARELREVE